jgi:mannosyltransferase
VALPRYEGYGITPLEGMACGLPVIASDTGYFSKFIVAQDEENSCGKIVPVEEYKTASKELIKLLSNEQRFKKFSKNALKQVAKNYSVLSEAMAINKVYEKLWSQK